ncbi:hypothetical protein [Leptothoe spongobia]|uniref:Uncharacterized protein n=1 Tax=Leptothoe spongobia TAU-MAC 1115 TaxID=1967444 RepID=A0A947DIA6_9CYAN|nr:hypothetical protein [Leptothoe spongobia]MBT9317040.1 hypothetical protein [Leptothoe spongobia TAU-MAC 1115]
MNDLDMELQTIRQKLQTLKASPPEPLAAPWGQSRLAAPSPNLAQVTTAIKTLRQRSHQAPAPNMSDSSLQQFDAALSAVENLAQQQEQALQRLKALGDSLTQQIQPGISPDIDDIKHFFAQRQTIQIPTVQRDHNGCLDLAYHTVTLHQAEHAATSNAVTLSNRSSQLFQHPLHQSPAPDTSFDESIYTEADPSGFMEELTHFWKLAYRSIQSWTKRYVSAGHRNRASQFTLLDGAIWCIGAAISRIILHQIFQVYPPLWTPVALVLIGGIILNLYRAIFSPRPNPILGYRTLMIIIGLLIGGRFV